MQQLIGDGAVTVFEIADTTGSPVASSPIARWGASRRRSSCSAIGAQLAATLAAGLLAEVIGLRATLVFAPLGDADRRRRPVALTGPPLLDLPEGREPDPQAAASEALIEAERDQPFGA